MTAQEFAQALKDEKEGMLSSYFGRGESPAGTLLKNLGAPSADEKVLRDFLDGVLTDAFYTARQLWAEADRISTRSPLRTDHPFPKQTASFRTVLSQFSTAKNKGIYLKSAPKQT